MTTAPIRQAFIGVGSNLGDRWATIRAALKTLATAPGIAAVETSKVYETDPVGKIDQPRFLNLVVGLETTLAPEEMLGLLFDLERAAGRRRDREKRWGPRTLDLDLLLYENETRSGPDLMLPHPPMWERSFVTVPLRELLARSERFNRPAWNNVKMRLAQTPAGPGVTPWALPD
ncbi:MAG: 2-amino-4-hydroxy-6-hydroxymethyldihydropteridine diphosphokinase [Verrucomicrobiota bacterium]|nr:2-amino-4-hydroxy-6-hydroxymethyldihydropteridine diphosphokinase [Verrucomicrobiota bacterium]